MKPKRGDFLRKKTDVVRKHDPQPHLYVTHLIKVRIEQSYSDEALFSYKYRRRLANPITPKSAIQVLSKQISSMIDGFDCAKPGVESRAVLQPNPCQLCFGIPFNNDVARRK